MTFHATILFLGYFFILYFSIKVSIFALVGFKIKGEDVWKMFFMIGVPYKGSQQL